MSVLDQAFFKAYGLADEPDEAQGRQQPVPTETASAVDAVATALVEPSCPLEGQETGVSLSASILAWTPWPATEAPPPAGQTAGSIMPDSMPPASAPSGVDAEKEKNSPVPENDALVAEENAPAAPVAPADIAAKAPAAEVAGPSMPPPEKERASEGFLPQLQVDRYFWPAAVIRLCQAAEGPLDAVIDTVALEAAQGRNVVGIGHCRSGDGATTLLLCLARRLAEHGVKVAIVDADLRSPRLARRLGVLAEAGWDDVCAGRISLAEVVIESLHDRIALVPRQEAKSLPPAGGGKPISPSGAADAAEAFSPQAVVAELRRHYDVVLVDLGHCSKDAPAPALTGERPWVDRVILVRNERRPRPAEFASALRQLESLGIGVAVVDNFV